MRTYIPVHDDRDFNDQWWFNRGAIFIPGAAIYLPLPDGPDLHVYYNAIRDGSGRFMGYTIENGRGTFTMVNTVAEAEQAIAVFKNL